jgi:hypothetical protein
MKSWIEQWQEKREAELENVSYAKKRYEICKQCTLFNNTFKLCGDCKCFLPAKVRVKWVYCPIGKWGKEA